MDFFFQAEDGIRDSPVTGVQTCALPIYGVSWFENNGRGQFDKHHEITRHWGAYSVRPADLDHDSDLDLVLVGLQMERYWPEFERQAMIWLENDGEENFTSHNVDLDVPMLVTLEVVDINNDDIPEVFTGTHDYMGGSAEIGRAHV